MLFFEGKFLSIKQKYWDDVDSDLYVESVFHILIFAVAICPTAGKGPKITKSRQSENFLEFLQNRFF